MGREGEVVTEILREFERTHPGIRVEVQQLPWTAAHEKLLTAFAGEATPDVCQLGNTWIPEFAALNALEPLGERVAASAVIDPRDYFAGIWDTNVVGGELYGVPWYVDTRLLFYRRDILARAGHATPPRSWADWTTALAAVKRDAGRDRYAILLPLNEFEPLVALALQQSDPLLRDGGRWGNFRSEGFRRTLRFYVDMFRQGFAPPLTNADISNVWNEFGTRLLRVLRVGPVEHRRIQAPAARRPAGQLDDGAAARPRRARGVDRRRFEPRRIPQLAQQGRRVAADRIPVATRRAAAVPRAYRRLAAAP